MSRVLANTLALLALTTATAAQAQADAPQCLTRNEVHGMMAYFAPTMIHQLGENCRTFLPESGYMAKSLPSVEARYAAGKDSAWPMARSAILKFMSTEVKGQFDPSKLSDAALRPMADEILVQKLSFKMNKDKCLDAEDILQALAPLDPALMLEVITTVVGVVARKDKTMPVCARKN